MKTLRTDILTFIFIALLFGKSYAQLPSIGIKVPSKDERKAKQIEKSPARDQITFVEKEIADLQRSFKSDEWEKRDRYMKEKKDYTEAATRIQKIEETVAQIKEKDSKWIEKTDYSSDVKDLKASYDSKWNAFQEIAKKEDGKEFIKTKVHQIGQFTGNGKLYDYNVFSAYMLEQFNYTETKTQMEKLISTYPDLKEDYYYPDLKAFYEKDFPEFADKGLPTHLEKLRKEAAENFETNPEGSNRQLKEAMGYCKIMMEISSGHTQYKQILLSLEELNGKFDKYMNEKVYISEVHKKHAGETLFSNKPIVPGKEKESDFKNEFKENEPIFAITYFEKSQSGYVEYELYINDAKATSGNFMDRAMFADTRIPAATFYTFMVIPDPEYYKTKTVKGGAAYNAFKITELFLDKIKFAGEFADKKYKVGLEILHTKNTFTLDASAATGGMKKTYDALKKQRVDDLRLPKSAGSNTEISSAFSSAMTEMGQVLKVTLTDAEWTYRKNKLTGIILSREASGYVIVKDQTGKCYMFGGVVSQQKAGSSFAKAEIIKYFEDFDNVDANHYVPKLDGKDVGYGQMHGFEFNCANINK